MLSLIHDLASALFYVPGPFTNSPLKTLAFKIFSTSPYSRAYEHFHRDHNGAANLFWHIFGLTSTAVFCAGMLESLDRSLGLTSLGVKVSLKPLRITKKADDKENKSRTAKHLPVLSLSTTLAWIALLMCETDCPIASRIIACGLLVLVYVYRSAIADNWAPISFYSAAIQGCGIAVTGGWKDPAASFGASAKFDWMSTEGIVFMSQFVLARLAVNAVIVKFLRGRLQGKTVQCASVALPLIVYLAVDPFSKGKGGAIFGWEFFGIILTTLTGNPVFYFHGAGFTANVLQSVSHKITHETATLVQLHNLQDEVSHSIFFPLLLTHRIQEALGF